MTWTIFVVQEKDVLYVFCDELSWKWWWTVELYKVPEISWLAEWLLTSQRGHLFDEINFTVASFHILLLHKYLALQFLSLSTQTQQFPVPTLVNVHAWGNRETFEWSLCLSAFASVASTFYICFHYTELSCCIEVTGDFGVFSHHLFKFGVIHSPDPIWFKSDNCRPLLNLAWHFTGIQMTYKAHWSELISWQHALFSLSSIHDNLAMQVMVSLGVVWLRTLYLNFRWHHIFKPQI